jgi:competence protein ComEC
MIKTRKRVLLIVNMTISFVAGVMVNGILHLPLFFFTWMIVAGAIVAIIALRRKKLCFLIGLFALMFAIGAFYLQTYDRRFQNAAESLPFNHTIELFGTVHSRPENKTTGETQNFIISDAYHYAADERIFLNNVKLRIIADKALPSILPGDKVVIRGTVNRLDRKMNPGENMWLAYSKSRDLAGWVYAGKGSGSIVTTGTDKSIAFGLLWLGEWAKRKIYASLPKERADIVIAMVLGDDYNLEPSIYDDYRQSGIVHLLSVSGVHVGFLILVILVALRSFKLPNMAIFLASVAMIGMYIVMVQWESPALRSALMAFVIGFGTLFKRKSDGFTLIALTVMVMVLKNPYYVFQQSFQLSCLGTLGMIGFPIFFDRYLLWLPRRWAAFWSMSFGAVIMTMPLTGLYYSQFSPMGIVTNTVAIPLGSFIVATGMLAVVLGYIFPLMWIILQFAGLAANLLNSLANIFATLPLASINFARFGLFSLLSFYLMVLFLIAADICRQNKQFKGMYIFVACLLAAFMIGMYHPVYFSLNRDKLYIYALNTGQGLSCLIIAPGGETALIDCGGNKGADVGENVIHPALASLGIHRLDYLILTHPHADHVDGYEAVLKYHQPRNIVIGNSEIIKYEELIPPEVLSQQKIVKIESSGTILDFEKGSVDCFFLPSNSRNDNLNEESLVILLRIGEFMMLVPSDSEGVSLMELNESLKNGDIGKVVVAFLPHHGSYNGQPTINFINYLDPHIWLINTGRNSYGHPARKTCQLLMEGKGTVLRTDVAGAIRIISDGKSFSVKKYGGAEEW